MATYPVHIYSTSAIQCKLIGCYRKSEKSEIYRTDLLRHRKSEKSKIYITDLLQHKKSETSQIYMCLPLFPPFL
jgi:hypothetical protein